MFNIIFFLWGYLSPNSKCNCRFKMQLWNSFAASPSVIRATTSIGICNKIYMQKSKIKFYLSFRVSGHSLDVSLILLDLSQGINCKIVTHIICFWSTDVNHKDSHVNWRVLVQHFICQCSLLWVHYIVA